MIVGPKLPGAAAQDLAGGQVRVSTHALSRDLRLAALTAYLDGLGPSNGPQVLRGVVYDAQDTLLATSAEVVIADGQAGAWTMFTFPEADGLELVEGDVSIGLIAGATGASARVWRTAVADGHRSAADPYNDGPASPLPAPADQAGVLSAFLTVFDAFSAPEDVDEEVYANFPFEVSQRILGAGGTVAGSRVRARAGFHGTALDPHEGAYAIVRSDGPLAELVGERLRVSHETANVLREAFVFVHDEQEWPEDITDEDFSLTRRAWLALALWPSDPINVYVEVMA